MNIWATALAANTLMILGAGAETFADSLRERWIRLPSHGDFVACPTEVSIVGSAGSVRSDEVRLAVGSRHRELGLADVHGANNLGPRQAKGINWWW